MSLENDFDALKTISKDQEKNIFKDRESDVKRDLQDCMYKIRIDSNKKKHRTKISRKFQEFIVNYNNILKKE